MTIARKIEKEESLLDWNMSAVSIHNRVRGFTMGPGTFVMFQEKRLKIHKTQLFHPEMSAAIAGEKIIFEAGTIHFLNEKHLVLQCGEGLLELLEVQPESKPKIAAVDFIKSAQLLAKYKKGDRFV